MAGSGCTRTPTPPAWSGCSLTWNAAPRPPSFLFIMADHLGFADLSCYGRRDYATPVLDRLAAEGIRFTQAYANSAVCTASRVALITGRYQYRLPIGLEEPLGRNGRRVGLELQDVGGRNHPHHPAAGHHRETGHLLVDEQLEGLPQGRLRGHGNDVRGHEVAEFRHRIASMAWVHCQQPTSWYRLAGRASVGHPSRRPVGQFPRCARWRDGRPPSGHPRPAPGPASAYREAGAANDVAWTGRCA